ncbi:MAG: TraG/TraD/VirD4 family protein, partial [Chloroflexota bacterium]|nr:TraG/TraD/VirD4 family protein [Chloroflexota bacterium]
FARIDPATWGKAVGMQQYLQMATLLVLEGEAHATLATVKQALVDAGYRARLLAQTRNPEVKTFWEITFPQLGESQKTSRDALLRRFDLLLTAETTRYLVTQALPTFDFLRAIEAGLIVLVPLPDMTLGGMAGVIGTLVLQAFVRAAFARAGSDQTRRSYPLVVDEFQVLVGTGDAHDVETALTRLRSLGIPALYAHQALTQLGDLADLMRINAQNRLILQTQEPDASIYAQQFGASGVTAVDISQQDPGEHQYAALRCGGTPTGLFSIHPLPWPAPVAVAAPAYTGPDWRTVIPEDAPDRAYDREVLRLVYGTHAEPQQLGERLARGLSEREWRSLLERWEAIRLAQRAHILAHPGCIPDRLERQQWLSRLLVARPRILAEVEYYRQRPALAAPGATPARSRDGGHETRSKAAPVAVRAAEVADAQQETWSTQARADDALAPHAAPAEPPLPASQRFLE